MKCVICFSATTFVMPFGKCWPCCSGRIVLRDDFIGLLPQCDLQKLLLMHDNRSTPGEHWSYDVVNGFIGCHVCFQSHELTMCEYWIHLGAFYDIDISRDLMMTSLYCNAFHIASYVWYDSPINGHCCNVFMFSLLLSTLLKNSHISSQLRPLWYCSALCKFKKNIEMLKSMLWKKDICL